MRQYHHAACALLLLVASIGQAWPSDKNSPSNWLATAVDRLCGSGPADGILAQELLPGTWLTLDRESGGKALRGPRQFEQRFAVSGSDELRVLRLEALGRMRRFRVEYHKNVGDELLPYLHTTADARCRVRAGRRIMRSKTGPDIKLQHLDSDLVSVRWTETLQAPWPRGKDPGGARVALVDSGLAYDLPLYRNRLARGRDGVPLGFDFWDLDPWPYDADVSRSPFLPIRHGSAVASILVREAPTAALMPYRYPRPKMARMAELIDHAAQAGARIIAMPLGSNRPEDWSGFEKAMRRHPELLAIVSAGNNGRDLDKEPLWPAALSIDNLIIVTSADDFGRLATGSNWGRNTVDIMLAAENVPVIDFRGTAAKASGSSYAVPRLAAIAARILAIKPNLTTGQLKAQIFARAIPSPYERKVVSIGWILDPLRE